MLKSFSPLQGQWFSEQGDQFNSGHAVSLKVKNVVCHEKSKFQDILIFDSESCGRVFVLDGMLQCTSKNEFAYHEMITHIPMFCHPCPKSILVVGGGDGGVLREVGKHPMVEEIHLCDLDEKVIELSKKYLPHVAIGFDNPKVQVHIQDGLEFLEDKKERFDVIITDSSDPIGPADTLFELAYFQRLKDALRPDGIICMQGECVWIKEDMELMQRVMNDCRKLFPVTTYAFISDPTCTTGQIGIVLASKNEDLDFGNPLRKISEQEADEMNLRYYDSQVHKGAVVLPRFVKKGLGL